MPQYEHVTDLKTSQYQSYLLMYGSLTDFDITALDTAGPKTET